jgi:hypothetical protein
MHVFYLLKYSRSNQISYSGIAVPKSCTFYTILWRVEEVYSERPGEVWLQPNMECSYEKRDTKKVEAERNPNTPRRM